MPEIEPAHDDARDQPEAVALRNSEPTPPVHTANETDLEPGADLGDHDGEPGGPTRDEPEHDEEDRRGESWWRRFIGSTPFLILVALAVAILVKTFVIQAFYIPSESMVPTLEVGDRVFVSKFMFDGGDIARGDVIVFENPNAAELPDRSGISSALHWLGEGIGLAQPENEDFIKRVIALPGETIEIRHNVVYINGKPLDEPYLTQAARDSTGDYPLHTVPDDALFVMGDNRGNSADSRYGLGFVPLEKVIGKAFVIIWPPSQMGGLG
jgi:signal peptidase I